MPQIADIDRSFPISVYDMVAMGLWRRKGLFAGDRQQDHATIEAAIAAVGLTGFEQRPIGTLSGGQMQRMLFARLLLQDARLIVLDEPFTAIDAKTSADLLDLVRRWHSEQRTVIAALHDIDLVKAKFPQSLSARPRAGRLGRNARCFDGGEPQQGAPHVRGVRRARRGLRGRGGLTRQPMLYDALIAPFADFEFMRRALVGSLALALGAPPVGVFLMLRRMSLIGDAMAHAILPGAAIGFLLAGLSLFAMAGGGLIAGFLIAFGAGLIARATLLKEDASLAAFFLISLALGVTIVSVKGNNVDLLHFLFGSVLAIDDPALMLIVSITSVSLIVLALIWRPLVLECVDPGIFALGEPGRRTRPYRLPRAGGDEPRRRVSGARHAACRRHHDAAGGDLAILGARHHRHDRRGVGRRRDLQAMPACSFPITPICRRDRPSSWWRACFTRCRSCSVRSAACSGLRCRNGISKHKQGRTRERRRKMP